MNKKLNIEIIYDERLRERNLGSLEGKKWDDFDDLGLRENDKNQTFDYRPYGGEDVEQVKSRVLECLKEIKEKNPDSKVLAVTSGGIIRLLHSIINNEIHLKIHNTEIHEFEF